MKSPPVCGNLVESSAIQKAPIRAIKPPITQAKIRERFPATGSAAKPTSKKIPEPIIFPVTIDVASKTPRTLLLSDILIFNEVIY